MTTAIDLDMSPKACVARGVELLDTVRPGWREALQHETIKMTDGYACVAGRLFGNWGQAQVALAPGLGSIEQDRFMARHGFLALGPCGSGCCDDRLDSVATEALAPLWLAEINRP